MTVARWRGQDPGRVDQVPSYRAMPDREGLAGPEDVAIFGEEEAVPQQDRALPVPAAIRKLPAGGHQTLSSTDHSP
jgi:hypothetical protein